MSRPEIPSDPSDWALLLGPGEDLERLFPLLETLASERADDELLGIDQLGDLGELFQELPDRGRLVLHAAWLPLEDLGLVRRFRDAAPGWELVLVGLDPGASAPRRLLREPQARWFSEPLDLDQLDELLTAPELRVLFEYEDEDGLEADDDEDLDPLSAAMEVSLDEDEIAAFRQDPPDSDWPEADDSEDDEFEPLGEPTPEPTASEPDAPSPAPTAFDEEIERILAVPARPSTDEPVSAPESAPEQGLATALEPRPDSADPSSEVRAPGPPPTSPNDPFGALLRDVAAHQDAPEPSAPAELAPEGPAEPPAATDDLPPAPYFKHQVADLADIALRIELSLEMARERAMLEDDLPTLDDLELEVQRLAQFTRTLGYLSAPPVAGRTRIALGQMVEEMLAEAGQDEHSPRYLWRSDGSLHVRCDKTLMHHALEAVLYLVHHCAGPAGTVRVEGRATSPANGSSGEVLLSLRFPPGPLTDLDPTAAIVPYALRTMLPDLGPNALAAASGILRGQGGDLSLSSSGEEWVWRLRLPRA